MNFVTGSYSFHMCFSVTISLIVTFFHMLIFQNFTQVSGISKNYLVTIKGILFNPRKSTWCKKASCYYCFCQRHTCDKMQKYTCGTLGGQPFVTLSWIGKKSFFFYLDDMFLLLSIDVVDMIIDML